jgi:thiol-disulfide isomerase/thioredoxin
VTNKQTISWKILLLLAFIVAIAGYAIYSLSNKTGPVSLPQANDQSSIVSTARAGFTLPDLEGKPRHIKEWDGKVVLLNFWATWCPPCRREMPGFIEVREQYAAQGFEIVGIAIDAAKPVREFTANLGVNYPVLHGQNDASIVASHYGNAAGMLPFSVIIDRQGIVQYARAGELTKAALEKELKKWL